MVLVMLLIRYLELLAQPRVIATLDNIVTSGIVNAFYSKRLANFVHQNFNVLMELYVIKTPIQCFQLAFETFLFQTDYHCQQKTFSWIIFLAILGTHLIWIINSSACHDLKQSLLLYNHSLSVPDVFTKRFLTHYNPRSQLPNHSWLYAGLTKTKKLSVLNRMEIYSSQHSITDSEKSSQLEFNVTSTQIRFGGELIARILLINLVRTIGNFFGDITT